MKTNQWRTDVAPEPTSRSRQIANTDRAQEMVRRGHLATKVSIAFVSIVVVGLPILDGKPMISAFGVAVIAILALSLRFTEHQARVYAICLQSVYAVSLSGLVYSIFWIGLDPVVSVYFPPIVVLGCAYILGWRSALMWTAPCIAIMAAAVYFPPTEVTPVDRELDFMARVGGLLTVLAFAISFRRSHDRQAAELAHLAGTDQLTGLSNRLALRAAINVALSRAARFERGSGIIFVDLDNMKNVNDTHGHDLGDAYLRTVAERIRRVSRSYDTLARIGGDEFVVLLAETADSSGSRTYADKLMREIAQPMKVDGIDLMPGASIGFACFPEDGHTAEDLLRAADQAMYAAKETGGNRVIGANQIQATHSNQETSEPVRAARSIG